MGKVGSDNLSHDYQRTQLFIFSDSFLYNIYISLYIIGRLRVEGKGSVYSNKKEEDSP